MIGNTFSHARALHNTNKCVMQEMFALSDTSDENLHLS